MSKHHKESCCDSSSNAHVFHIITVVLLVLILVLGLTGKFSGESLTKDDVSSAVKAAMNTVGNRQVGAPGNQAKPNPAPTPAQQAPQSKVDLKKLEDFYSTSYIKGNKDAKVTVIEFSDFECPFCKRHSSQGTLDAVLEKYGDDVNVVFTHFPLSFHPLAQKAQEASECVAQQGGSEAFYAFKDALFQEPKPTMEAIEKVVASLEGIDAAKVKTCLENGEMEAKVKAAMNFGRSLGVTGTPGNIVVNNETGEFVKVSGAVPASAFDGPISQMLE